ncbi:MAG: hemerythrin domain-containing protein [Candidatus Palauibacterales bacterium]|nr:hemerythrin domain-containing protein [Candidatus Palauibacterales bacterium]MDP2530419.1 hemerythrin domain-containing protein [Candidatus Palauibacterales bacterium]MDP2583688.1 hemerythrin domain-containing protein [Candidatus Palauibacterales bacterium]
MGPGAAAGGPPRVTDALRGEHGALYALFGAVGDLLDEAPEDGDRARLLGRLLAPVLASHAGLEDGLLLPALQGQDPGPLAAMAEEHRGIESLLERLARERDAGRVRDLLEELLDAARVHFEREEVAAFPFAEAHLEDGVLRRLGSEWAARRGVRTD